MLAVLLNRGKILEFSVEFVRPVNVTVDGQQTRQFERQSFIRELMDVGTTEVPVDPVAAAVFLAVEKK